MKGNRSFVLQETLTYVFVWTFVMLLPLFFEWFMAQSGGSVTFEWSRVIRGWINILPFFLFFCIHNWLIAPILAYRQKRLFYIICSAALAILFAIYQCNDKPPTISRLEGDPFPKEQMGEGPPPDRPPIRRDDQPQWQSPDDHRPPLIVGQHDVVAVIVLLLIFFANLGVKYYFRHRLHELQLKELERKNLEERLAYLRYQVNPHFLMNTLNNIHSLIDIDPERAQKSIVEFSRLLRYTLYDAEHEYVPFPKEVAFVHNYLELMRMRFSDEVDIQFDIPEPLPSGNVPPLIYACFVENAFKYGVSYQQPSFVHITFSSEVEGRLQFSCINSLFPKSESCAVSGGLGLRNVRQRLDIMFPNDHSLVINETENTYAVRLDIPFK